ncbi:MAG: glycosyl hydrolase family 18 protein [Lachnospiraceae bacterium]|nr:glycosyl hydrolase family 18 protein [Lachnospiraceae bacterium]MDY5699512.1 glycosyl hydrolase family 18 protein [Lachnospiraceae bacterium]
MMKKKVIPVLVAVALIIVIGGAGLLTMFLGKYSYADTLMDLDEYFEITEEDQVAIILKDEYIETKARLKGGAYYLDFDSVQKLLNKRFYEDEAEMLLLFTTPTEIIQTAIGSDVYYQGNSEVKEEYPLSFYQGETLYVALDFVQKFTNFSYEAFTAPNRICLNTEWGETTVAQVKKDTAVRYRGGVKSDILREVARGETVTILEELENWVKVKTSDALIGYIEKKRLTGQETIQEAAVSHYDEPEYTSLVRDYKINLGWHQVMSEAANATLDDVVRDTQGMNVISPTWFALTDNEGGIRSIASQNYVSRAHSLGLEVWALVDNFDNNVSSYEVLSKTSSRTRLIQNLMNEVLRYDIDGINVDFEDLSYDAGEPFVQFLRELSIQCRLNGIVLSVDNYVPRESTAHYDRPEQGVVADYVIIMGYDEHWGGGGVAGSVASIGFVEDGIRQTVDKVPSHKVINALPFYTRVWKTREGQVSSEALDMETAQNFITNNNVEVYWDQETCQNYGQIQKGDTLYQVWLEDAQSIETKLTIMQKYDLGGVAAWKLGFETPDIWAVIAAYLNS